MAVTDYAAAEIPASVVVGGFGWEDGMIVAWIFKDKGRHVVSVLSGTSLTEVIVLLDKNRIGAIVIVDEQHHVQGILSERDIVRILATRGTSALNEPVKSAYDASGFDLLGAPQH